MVNLDSASLSPEEAASVLKQCCVSATCSWGTAHLTVTVRHCDMRGRKVVGHAPQVQVGSPSTVRANLAELSMGYTAHCAVCATGSPPVLAASLRARTLTNPKWPSSLDTHRPRAERWPQGDYLALLQPLCFPSKPGFLAPRDLSPGLLGARYVPGSLAGY